MANSTQAPDKDKYDRLHQLAVSLYHRGEYSSALQCWKKIRQEYPIFYGLEEWIQKASEAQLLLNRKQKPAKTPASAFREKRDLIDQSKGRITFKPLPGQLPEKRILKHRHIAFLLIAGFLLFCLASVRNKRMFLLSLEKNTGELIVYQGSLFPYGWEKRTELSVGLEPGWENELENESLKHSLLSGLRVKGQEEFDKSMIRLFQILGKKALSVQTIDSQRRAIYYFKQIEKAQFRDIVSWDIATAFFNLAKIYFEELNQPQTSLDLLKDVKRYIPSYPGCNELNDRILQSSGRFRF